MDSQMNKKALLRITYVVIAFIILIVYASYASPGFTKIEGQRKFGATYMTMNNPFFEVINEEIEKEVVSKGDILITLDPGLDMEKQNEQIYSLISQEVDAIFVNPIDWQKIEPALRAAKEAGIPIIVVDAPVDKPDLVDCTIASDNYDAGVQCARDMMAKKESANIILLEHSSAKSAKDRITGFLDTIEGYPQYRIINRAECEGQLEKAMPIMESMLDSLEQVDVIMALNDPSALGALAALEAKGLDSNVLIYGVDGSPEVKSLLKHGSAMQATAAQSPIKIGQLAVAQVYELLGGKTISEEIIVPVTMIREENIDMYNVGGWQ